MQRIDENTYIDDTLVTCAEYQLFIDEMREQGKYYQPDHWTSYQFSEGQAREPILGVRQSNALDFCKWLAKRRVQEWKFRLPTQKEVNTFPINNIGINPLGYWIGNDYKFTWIATSHAGSRAVDFSLTYKHAINLDKIINHDRAFARTFARAFDHDHTRGDAIFHAFSNTLDDDNTLDRALKIARSLTLATELKSVINTANFFEIAQTLNNTRLNALDSIRSRSIPYGIYTYLRKINNTPINPNFIERVAFKALFSGTHDVVHEQSLNLVLKLILEVYTDLYTIQERIAGRSPAFEGIRLVKERIR
jgi:hypothetical protein